MSLPRALALIFALAAPAAAETRLSPEAFEAMSEGRTIYFARRGEIYGAEQYFDGREVIWRFAGDRCIQGFWFAQEDDICFLYVGQDGVQCWGFYRDEDGYFARALGGDPADDLRVMEVVEGPLECPGPDTGV